MVTIAKEIQSKAIATRETTESEGKGGKIKEEKLKAVGYGEAERGDRPRPPLMQRRFSE